MHYDLSVVIPAYNESEGLSALMSALTSYTATADYAIQYVFVDDGSSDNTAEQIAAATIEGAGIKLVKLSRNFGAHEAIRAGVYAADAERVIFYSADMPEPVEDIGLLYEKLAEGYELVYSERLGYNGGVGSSLFSWLTKHMVKIDFPQNGLLSVGFGAKIKRELNANIEASSSIFYQIFSLGFKKIGIPVEFTEREYGSSKWTLRKKVRHFLDVFTMFSYTPIHIISLIGFLFFVIGIVWTLVIVISKLVAPESVDAGWPTALSIMLIGFGVTNLSLGIIAEYLARTLVASRKRPAFIIDEVVDKD